MGSEDPFNGNAKLSREQNALVTELRNFGTSPTAAASLTLPALYSTCERLLTGSGRDAVLAAAQGEPQLLLDAASLLAEAAERIDVAGVFSSNEDADDVATTDLKYLLLPFIQAELLMLSPAPASHQQQGGLAATEGRLRTVVGAIMQHTRFLTRAAGQYGLAGEAGQRILQLEADEEEASGGADASTAVTTTKRGGGGGNGGMDPNARRLAKVEKFKRERAIQAALAQIEHTRLRGQAQEQESSGTNALGGCGGLDEEDERTLWLLRLESACLQALASRQLMREELGILQHARGIEQRAGSGAGASASCASAAAGLADGRQRQRAGESAAEAAVRAGETAAMVQQLRGVAAALDGGRREQIRQQVLRPGHILPTMSIEELADIETADMMRRSAAEQANTAARAARVEELGSDEDEEEVMAQRARDDWKDCHPFGSGNSKLKPCG